MLEYSNNLDFLYFRGNKATCSKERTKSRGKHFIIYIITTRHTKEVKGLSIYFVWQKIIISKKNACASKTGATHNHKLL